MMNYTRRIINGEIIEKNKEMLSSFGEMDHFKTVDERLKRPPEVLMEIPNLSVLSKIKPPYKYETLFQLNLDFHPIL